MVIVLVLLYVEYVRHVILPKELAKQLPKGQVLPENEWRGIGVQQSRGWAHYACHRLTLSSTFQITLYFHIVIVCCRPEPHILLFRRPLGTDPLTGDVNAELERDAKEQYQQQIAMNLRK